MNNISKIRAKLKELSDLVIQYEIELAQDSREVLNVVAIESNNRDTYVFPDRTQEDAERIFRMMFPDQAYRVCSLPYRVYFRVREFYSISDFTTN